MATKQGNKGKQKPASDETEPKKSGSKGSKAAQKNDDVKSQDQSAEPDDADIDEGEELNTLIETLQDEDLTSMDIEIAGDMIDEWYEILHKSPDADLKEIGNILKPLKKKISSKKADPAEIAEILSQLGEQIDGYADNAERGYKTKLHKLGKAFTKISRELEQDMEEDVEEDVEDEDMLEDEEV